MVSGSATSEPDELETVTWPMVGTASRELASEVAARGDRPDIVLCIARGGLIVGGAIAYALGVKRCATINVDHYRGVDQRLEAPRLLPPVPDPGTLAGLDVLVADDVADTGRTLAAVRDLCRDHVRSLRTAVMFRKPWSVTDPDHVWRETRRWIAFPWSADGPVPGADDGR